MDVDGDIDGNGNPDVTLENDVQGPADCGAHCGFTIASSGNRLRALMLRGFTDGVAFFAGSPPRAFLASHTFANNVVSNVVMDGLSGNGIAFVPTGTDQACLLRGPACDTHNSWVDTQLVGNTIDARDSGIAIGLEATIGDRIERLTIAGNNIRADGRAGIGIAAGGGAGSDGNVLSEVTLAGNTISGHSQYGIRLAAGEGGAHANTVGSVHITGNKIDLAVGSRPDRAEIVIGAGDGGTDYLFPDLRPVVYSENNVMRDVEISGNTLAEGPGVWIGAGAGGDANNTVDGVRIANNEIQRAGPDAAVQVESGTSAFLFTRTTAGARVSNVSIDSNHITYSKGAWVSSPIQFPPYAGVLLVGGDASRSGSLTGVTVTGNRIENPPIGVSVLAGRGANAMGDAFHDVPDNQISGAVVRGNTVTGYLRSGVLAIGGSGCNDNRYTVLRNAIRGLTIEGNDLTAATGRANTSGAEITGGDGCGDAVSENGVEQLSASGNTIRGGSVGIRLSGGIGATANRNRVQGTVGDNTFAGIGQPIRVASNEAGASANAVDVALPQSTLRYAGVVVTARTARLKAAVDPRGSDTTFFAEYGRSKRLGRATAKLIIRAADGERTISAGISGLRPGTTYHYRLVARSRAGATSGQNSTFRTKRARR